jgi:hypothetical protein
MDDLNGPLDFDVEKDTPDGYEDKNKRKVASEIKRKN